MQQSNFNPDWISSFGETLSAQMVRKNLGFLELADAIGETPEDALALIEGNGDLQAETAQKLASVLGASQAFWMKRYSEAFRRAREFAEALPEDVAQTWLRKLPLKEIAGSARIAGQHNRVNALIKAFSFFSVVSPWDWEMKYASYETQFSFRTSEAYETRLGALAAWLRRSEIHANLIRTAPWNPERLSESIEDIRGLSFKKSPTVFLPKLRAICADAGVAVVITKAPSGSRASGATRFLTPHKAMIALSMRYRSDDHFWFTVLHEVAHLLLHGPSKTFVDDEATEISREEEEANNFAASALVPIHRHEEMLSLAPRVKSVIRFAISVGVSPGIIVGQMQKHGALRMNQLNNLKRRYQWEDIENAAFYPVK